MKEIILQELAPYVESFYVYERESYIELSNITIKKEYRSQGYATRIMNNLCNYANSVEKPILLTPEAPEDDKELSTNQLISFYERFDFQPNKGKIRDYSMASHSYKRMPQ